MKVKKLQRSHVKLRERQRDIKTATDIINSAQVQEAVNDPLCVPFVLLYVDLCMFVI